MSYNSWNNTQASSWHFRRLPLSIILPFRGRKIIYVVTLAVWAATVFTPFIASTTILCFGRKTTLITSVDILAVIKLWLHKPLGISVPCMSCPWGRWRSHIMHKVYFCVGLFFHLIYFLFTNPTNILALQKVMSTSCPQELGSCTSCLYF